MQRINNERGIALIISLFIIVMLLGFSSVLILRTVNESNQARIERESMKAFFIAESGMHNGLDGLDNLINNLMLNTVNNMNPSTVISKALTNLSDGVQFLYETVEDNGNPVLIINGNRAEYTTSSSFGSGSYAYDIIITEKTNPVTVTPDTWDFPYNYRVEATGSVQGLAKNVLLSGDFTVRVQRDNFAKYALFTNRQEMSGGTNIWFTGKTNFAGPVHTNKRFNIALNPSATFDGAVTQHEQTARFYNGGWPVLLDADFNGNSDTPTFNAGFTRGVDPIALSSSAQQQDMIDQATGGNTYSTDGIYIPNSGGALTGGIYVKGNAEITLSNSGPHQTYIVQQGSQTIHVTPDKLTKTTTIWDGASGYTTYNGLPDGVDDVGTIVYVDGGINSIGGYIVAEEQATIASDQYITIEDNVTYVGATPAVGTPGTPGYVAPHNSDQDNLLGLVSWNGSVAIGHNAPDNISIHATILAQNDVVMVEGWSDSGVGPRGTATLLGGAISDNYGAFGTFSGSTGALLSGYGRNFVYDQRMAIGNAPPYFPSLNTFIAFTNDITDKMIWQESGL